jgi:hypothetical protein
MTLLTTCFSIHVPLFANILILGVAIRFLLLNDTIKPSSSKTDISSERLLRLREEGDTSASSSSEESSEEGAVLQHLVYTAIWTAAISLATSLQCMVSLALLNKTLDRPKTLIVNNRYVRLAPRMAAVPIIACLPIGQHILPGSMIGYLAVIMYILIMWEKICTMEHGGALFEPWDDWKKAMNMPETIPNDKNDAENGENGRTKGQGNGGPDLSLTEAELKNGRETTLSREEREEREDPGLFREESGRSRGFEDVEE